MQLFTSNWLCQIREVEDDKDSIYAPPFSPISDFIDEFSLGSSDEEPDGLSMMQHEDQ